jgi:uncharacterized protein GlcG (DUF336 family)
MGRRTLAHCARIRRLALAGRRTSAQRGFQRARLASASDRLHDRLSIMPCADIRRGAFAAAAPPGGSIVHTIRFRILRPRGTGNSGNSNPFQTEDTSMSICTRMAVATAIAMTCSWAGAQSLVSERSISMNAALELASASLERCRADGYKVTVAVLNRHARTAVVLSDDGANPHTVENSQRKAYTAFTTRSPSGEMGKRAQPGLAGFLLLDRITTLEGGLPIYSGKELVGAIGISGAPGGDKDAACAQVGLDRIAKALAD